MKKALFVLSVFTLVLLMITPVFGGGRGQQTTAPATVGAYVRDPNLNPPGTFPVNKTRVPLKIGVGQYAMVENWETNWMTLQIEEKGNYDLTFETYPDAELRQKVELMIMAGGSDLPDILWFHGANQYGTFDLGAFTKYGEAGMIIPLNTYYANSAHYINLAKPQYDIDILKYITSYDGNIYGLPSMMGGTNNEYSSNWVMIYEPWLEKIGMSMPKTITELENVLKAFKDRDPNGNGRQDEIPLIGNTGNSMTNLLRYLMNPFIYTQENYWIMTGGRIDVAFNKPAWRDGLRFVKSLLDQGLLSPLSYTQNSTQMTAMINPDPPIIGAFSNISQSNLPSTNSKYYEYVRTGPITGPGGTNAFWNPALPSVGMVITKNCKTPEAAFMLGDLMCMEEISVWNRFGEKGVNWQIPGPNDRGSYEVVGFPPLLNNATTDSRNTNVWGIIQNKIFAQRGPFLIPERWPNGITYNPGSFPPNYQPTGVYVEPWVKISNKNPITGLIYNEAEQQVMNEFRSTILNYVHESYTRFVMGDLSIDRDWDNYVAEFNRMGLVEVLKATQSCWDRMNK